MVREGSGFFTEEDYTIARLLPGGRILDLVCSFRTTKQVRFCGVLWSMLSPDCYMNAHTVAASA